LRTGDESAERRARGCEERQLLLKGTILSTLIEHPTRILFFTGKGGVGKTTIAVRIATRLAQDGYKVLLTTTDPAAHVDAAARERPATLRVPVSTQPSKCAAIRRKYSRRLGKASTRRAARCSKKTCDSLTPLVVTDPVLRGRRSHEAEHLCELASHARRTALEPWHADVLAAISTLA
jgi:GTPase SAR1 family protein